jgi:hypothetical protein
MTKLATLGRRGPPVPQRQQQDGEQQTQGEGAVQRADHASRGRGGGDVEGAGEQRVVGVAAPGQRGMGDRVQERQQHPHDGHDPKSPALVGPLGPAVREQSEQRDAADQTQAVGEHPPDRRHPGPRLVAHQRQQQVTQGDVEEEHDAPGQQPQTGRALRVPPAQPHPHQEERCRTDQQPAERGRSAISERDDHGGGEHDDTHHREDPRRQPHGLSLIFFSLLEHQVNRHRVCGQHGRDEGRRFLASSA